MNTREELERLVTEMRSFADQSDAKSGGPTADDITKMNAMGARVRVLTEQLKAANAVGGVAPEYARFLEATGEATAPAGVSFAKAVVGAGFDLKSRTSVTVNAAEALGIKAPTVPDSSTWSPTSLGLRDLAADRRFIFPNLPSVNVGTATAVEDFRVTARALTGSVERDVAATTDKAMLNHTIIQVIEEIGQHAVIIPEVPNALLASMDGLSSVLEQEGRLAVMQSIDAHAYEAITTAAPFGSTGTGLVAQTRHAVAAMRAAGMAPNLLVLDPADAVTLDLAEDTAGNYIFALGSTGPDGSVWGLRVVEAVAATGQDPLLVDTSRIGRLFLGTMRFEANPFQNFRKNLTDLRVETNALMVTRDATAAYRIGALIE